MRRQLFAGLATLPLVLAGCGGSDEGKTEDLREFLRQAHEFDNGYDGLGEVTYVEGDVTVSTDTWADPAYGAYMYCAWVEDWLRGEGDADGDIVVVMDGEEILRARGASESCADAEPTTGP